MPAYRQFRVRELDALAAYIGSSARDAVPGGGATVPHRYSIDGYTVFTDPHGVPAVAPPWGTLNAMTSTRGDPVEGSPG